MVEIQTAAFKSAQDVVKAQIASGKKDHGMPGIRHIAVVSDVIVEILESYGKNEDTNWNREVLRAALSGSMLNASALRQDLEGKHKNEVILRVETALENEYGIAS